MASAGVELRWYLRSSGNQRMCYKSCAVAYYSLAVGSIVSHPEDWREVSQRARYFTNILKCL